VIETIYALTPKRQEDITMANKNHAGNQLHRKEKFESRLIDKIDQREKTGKNRENVDNQFNNFTISEDGNRVWSF